MSATTAMGFVESSPTARDPACTLVQASPNDFSMVALLRARRDPARHGRHRPGGALRRGGTGARFGASNFSALAPATTVALYGRKVGAALATVVGCSWRCR